MMSLGYDTACAWARVANGSVERPLCVPTAVQFTYQTRLETVMLTVALDVACPSVMV